MYCPQAAMSLYTVNCKAPHYILLTLSVMLGSYSKAVTFNTCNYLLCCTYAAKQSHPAACHMADVPVVMQLLCGQPAAAASEHEAAASDACELPSPPTSSASLPIASQPSPCRYPAAECTHTMSDIAWHRQKCEMGAHAQVQRTLHAHIKHP